MEGDTSMNQGQICMIKRRADGVDLGWFQKLRMEDGNIRFCMVRTTDQQILNNDGNVCMPAPIPDGEVDSSGNNKNPAKPYVAYNFVPASVQIRYTRFTADDSLGEDIQKSLTRSAIQAEIEKATAEYERAIEAYNRKTAEATSADQARLKVLHGLSELESLKRSLDLGCDTEFVYAYGVHESGGDTYCWRVPNGLEEAAVPGAVAIVDTKYGEQRAVITKIERSKEFVPHKAIVRIISQVY